MNDVPDDILLPLRERLSEWTDYDVAAFFLGKVLGVLGREASYSESKHMFFIGTGDGLMLLDGLIFLAGLGFLESRDNNAEFRWREEPVEGDPG